jgi:aspartate racemase
MEQDFYSGRLKRNFHLRVLTPRESDRNIIHRVIYEELCLGKILDESRSAFREIIQKLAQDGAQGVILGCTEIAMLLRPNDAPVPLFDTAEIHARHAVEWALGQ